MATDRINTKETTVMSLARLVITAVTAERRTKSAVARDYGITGFWVQTLVKRFPAEGEAAFQPQS